MIKVEKEGRIKKINDLIGESIPQSLLVEAEAIISSQDLFGFFNPKENFLEQPNRNSFYGRVMSKLWCCACRTESDIEKLKHNEQVRCPHCGGIITVRSTHKIKTFRVLQNNDVTVFENVDNALVIRSFDILRIYSGWFRYDGSYKYYGDFVRYNELPVNEYSRIILFKDGYGRYSTAQSTMANTVDIQHGGTFERKKNFSPPAYGTKFIQTKEQINDVIKSCAINPCVGELFNGISDDNITKITALYKLAVSPRLEYLYKLGYERLVRDYVRGRSKENMSLNLRAKTVNLILGVPHSILQKFEPKTLSEVDVKAIKQLIGYGRLSQLTNERLDVIRPALERNGSLCTLDIFNDFGFEKVINYVTRQAEANRPGCGCGGAAVLNPSDVFNDFLDYRKDIHEGGYDLKNELIMFPKNLYERHRQISQENFNRKEAAALLEAEAKSKSFFAAIKKYIKIGQTVGDYVISVATNPKELIAESAVLGHCVKNYVDKVVEKKAVIFFIRSAKSPDKPLYTLEYNPDYGRLIQLRGKANCIATKICQDIAEQFVKQIAARFKPKKAA